jgi:hypothetical protein
METKAAAAEEEAKAKAPAGLSINVEDDEEDKKMAAAAKAMTELTPKSAAAKLGVTGLSGEMAARIGGKAARKEANYNKK